MPLKEPISREAINEFKAAYLEDFGELLSDVEAKKIALDLLQFLHSLKSLPPEGKSPDYLPV